MEKYNNIILKIIFDLMILLIFYVFIKLIFLPSRTADDKEYRIQILIKKYIKLIFIFSFYFLIYLQF